MSTAFDFPSHYQHPSLKLPSVRIVLSAAVTLEAVNLIFKGANNGVDILNVEAEKVGNDVVVRGALRVKDLHLTSRLDIYLDSLITAHN